MKKITILSIIADIASLTGKAVSTTALPLFVLFFSTSLFAQTKTEEKANLAYQYKQFAQAASLYEEVILEKIQEGGTSRNTLNLKTKLANCYRMNNRLDLAEELYAEIVQDERAKSETYFYYGETLMSNGKYEEAKRWFLDYHVLEPEDGRGALMADNCDRVQLIEPVFPFVEITEYPYNSDADDNAPVIWQNGIVFSSDRKQGVKLMKEKSAWTGRDYLDLYFSELKEDSTYGEPQQFSAKLSEINKNTGNASFSTDGSEVFFTRNDNVLNKRETYNLQLFHSVNNGADRWKKAEKLSFCSPNFNYMHPAISPDGQLLFFATNMKGQGGTDLWVSKKRGEGWGIPENLGSTVNTPANEGFPFMDHNGKLYFCSKGHPGFGGFDIFFTEMNADGSWQTPQNLGAPINSSLDDISIYINGRGDQGLFTSGRKGGDDDIYLFQVRSNAPLAVNAEANPVSVKKDQIHINEKPGMEETIPFITDLEEKNEEVDVPLTQKEKDELSFFQNEEMPIAEEQTETISDQNTAIFFDLPEHTAPKSTHTADAYNASSNYLFSFQDFISNASTSKVRSGEVYRIDGATFDPNIWQLTPRISKKFDELAAVMRRFPAMRIELSAHTETPGLESHNLELSKNRVEMAIGYLTKEGIAPERIMGVGYGESMPLNRCLDGVACTEEEHLFNQRFEVKVIIGNEK